MKLTFVMVGSGARPIGGFRVIYEYANRLMRRGHRVTLVHAPYLRAGSLPTPRSVSVYVAKQLGVRGGPTPRAWFTLDPKVDLLWRPSLASRWIPDGDVVIATAWETAEWVATYPRTKGRKYYFIQDDGSVYPTATADRVVRSYTLPLTKLTISQWLADTVSQVAGPVVWVPNGLNEEDFGVDVPIEARPPNSIVMAYRRAAHKGPEDGLNALRLVAQQHPITVRLFGFDPPPILPSGWSYSFSPSRRELRALYNASAVFLSASRSEGWGLPPCEAAQCGVALAVTDIGGHREWASPNSNALLSPPGDPSALAANVLQLIEDDGLRTRLACAGLQTMKAFSWSKAVDRFEAIVDGVECTTSGSGASRGHRDGARHDRN